MLRPGRSKKKPPLEISDNKSTSTFTFSTPSPSPSLFGTGEKRGHPPSSTEKKTKNPQKRQLN